MPESRLTSSPLPGVAHSLLRVMTGLLYMQHGCQKMLGWFPDPRRRWMGPPPAFSEFWFAGILELVGGFLIVIGLFTRPVAFLLAGEMAVAFLQVHFPRSVFPIVNGGENVVLFCFVYLWLAAVGAGPYSADALLLRRRGLRSGAMPHGAMPHGATDAP